MRDVPPKAHVFALFASFALLTAAACDGAGGGRGSVYVPPVDTAGSDTSADVPLADAPLSDLPGPDLAPDPGPIPDLPDNAGLEIGSTPPDVKPPTQPLAGICLTDSDCDDGFCNAAYSGGYCTRLCSSDADCPESAKCYPDPQGAGKMCWKACDYGWQCRLDQFCPSAAKICTPKCQPDKCSNPSYVCNEKTGECLPPGSVVCEPTTEVCDGEDNDCDKIVDEGCGPTPEAGGPELMISDMGLVEVGGGGLSKELSFDLSSAAGSFTIIALAADAGTDYMGVYSLTSPSGQLLVAGTDPWNSPIRTLPEVGWVAVQVPNTTTVALESGRYTFRLWQDSADVGHAWVYVIQDIRSQYSQSEIDLNFWFVGLPNLTASTAKTSQKFGALRQLFIDVLDAYGIGVRTINYYDITGADAQKYSILDTDDDVEIDEHDELLAFSKSLPSTNGGVNFFFVKAFNGWKLLGKAGGIPGPALTHGTWGSGVAVSMADYLYDWDVEGAISLTVEAMAHEMGHQLGLFHTSEQDGSTHDTLPDTPECSYDPSGDGIVDAWECQSKGANNLMFWQANLSAGLTDGQLFVIHRNPNLYEK